MDIITPFLSKLISLVIPGPDDTFQILLIIMVIIWTTGRVFRILKFPPIIGEIIAGLVMGPAMLGLIPKNETIKVLGELGVFFMLFHAGLDTDAKEFIKSSKVSIAIACGGIVVLFIFVFTLMQFLNFSFITSVFMGAISSVTSLPVIVKTLKDFGLHRTKFGHTILASTVIDDVVGFILLSIVIAIATTGQITFFSVIIIIFKVVFFFVGTLFLGKKILPYFTKFLVKSGSKGFTLSLIIALVFGLFAEAIDLHIILGAYLAGVFVRQEIENQDSFKKIEDRFFGISHSFLGPIFFASVGMSVSFDVFTKNPILIILIYFAILFGQWLGTGGAAYFVGKFTFRESSAIAAAMSGRGVMEIVIASIGHETFITKSDGTTERLLSTELFSSVVAMAIIITFTMPFLVKGILPKNYASRWKVF